MKAGPRWGIFKGAFDEFFKDKVPRLSAALAYYALFSLAPLIIISVSVAGMFFGQLAVTGQLHDQLRDFFGDQGTQAIESMMKAAQKPDSSLAASIIGGITLLIGATGVFGQLQDALNTIWEVKPKPGRGIKGFIQERFLSLAMVLGIGFLLLVSMVLSAVLAALTGSINAQFGFTPVTANIVHVLVSFIVITLLFAMIFKYLPDARVQWRDVWYGAIFTAALFTVGKLLLGFYLGRAATASAYGAAGSLVLVLMWVYYSSIILFFGAEVTQVYAKARGSHIIPASNALPLTEEDRAEQGIPHEPVPMPIKKATKKPEATSLRHSASAHLSPHAPDPKALQAWEHIPKGSEVIQKKPWPFLSTAAGLGVLTGFLFKAKWIARRKQTSFQNANR